MSGSVSTTIPSQLRKATSGIMFFRVSLDSFREKTAVDGIDNGLGTDLSTTKKSPVQPLDGVFTSLYTIKLEVDVTLSVWIKGNMDNMTVFLFALSFDIVFKLLDPRVTFFPVAPLVEFTM
jgi:hypothetical protein